MDKKGKIKYTVGFLFLVILSSSIYIYMQDSVKISVEKTRTKFSVWENESWVLGATEYINIFDGTKKMRRKYNYSLFEKIVCELPIQINGWCSLSWNTTNNITYIKRESRYKDNISIIQTYKFDGNKKEVELFPIDHIVDCINCQGKIVHFEYRDILYEGNTTEISSPFSFGHKMKLEWQEGNYFSKVYQQIITDKIIIKYKPKKAFESYSVRLFDPPSNIKSYTIKQSRPNPGLESYSFSIDNGLKLTIPNASVTFKPQFVMQNNAIYAWGQIPDSITKKPWKIKTKPNEYKYGFDFYNVSDNIKNNLKYVVLHRTNVENLTGSDVVIDGTKIIFKNKTTMDFADLLQDFTIVSINKTDIVIGNITQNFISNGDGTWNISFDPTITIDEESVFTDVILTNVTVEANYSHLTVSDVIPYDDLVLYMPFDVNQTTTIYDWSSEENDGTINGAVFNSSGYIGGSYELDGINDYIDVGTGMWNSTGPVTFVFWNNVDPTNPNGFGGHGTDSSADRLQVHAPYSDGTLYWDYGDFSGNGRLSVSYSGYGNKWTHVALTSEGASGSGMKIYLDGIEVASSGVSDGPSGAVDFNIGAFIRSDNTDFFHKGQIDEVMMFNTSLNSSQITDIYNNQSARFKSPGQQTLKQINITPGYTDINVTAEIAQTYLSSELNISTCHWDISKDYNTSDFSGNDNLILYYNFDNISLLGENNTHITDRIGLNNGTANGSVVSTNAVFEKTHDLDGVNDYIQTTSNGFDISQGTVSVWINHDTSAIDYLFVHRTGTNRLYMYLDGANNYYIRFAGDSSIDTGANAVNGQWHHAVLTWTNTAYTAYFDGVNVSSGSHTSLSATSSCLAFGAAHTDCTGWSNWFDGKLDEAMIFNRSITSDEIKELYVKGRTLSTCEAQKVYTDEVQFSIDPETTNVYTDWYFNSDPNSFYSSILGGDITYTTWNSSVPSETIPQVTILTPINNSEQTSIPINFTYNVTATTGIDNCSLIINSTINQTDTSITINTNQSFGLSLANGIWDWSVNCSNSAGTNNSLTYNLSVNAVNYGSLNVSIILPINNTDVNQYSSFIINATVTCVGEVGDECGIVYANARYNGSSATPDTNINTTFEATPFYILNSWNLSTFIYNGVNISTQDGTPSGIFFKSDGTKLYETGSGGDKIYQYTCSDVWNLSSCSYDSIFISTQNGAPTDIFFKSDGTKLYESGYDGLIYQYTCSDAWNLSSCSYDSIFISTQNSFPTGMSFKSDGTKLYETGIDGDKIHQYSCSTAWDLSSCSYDSIFISTQNINPQDIFFKSDGLRLYELGSSGDNIYQYSCSTAWDLSSCSYDNIFISPKSGTPQGIFFKSDGTKLYITESNSDSIYQYSLIEDKENPKSKVLNQSQQWNILWDVGVSGTDYTYYIDVFFNSSFGNTNVLNKDTEDRLVCIEDCTAPAYSLNSTNSTIAGESILHSLKWEDNIELSGHIFQWCNGTWNGSFCIGSGWVNDTFVSMTGINNWSNVSKTIQSTVGLNYSWCVYANDTSNNWNDSCSTPFTYTSTSAAPVDTCTYTSGNYNVDCSDNCSEGNIDLGGNNFNITGTGTFKGNLTNYANITVEGSSSCSAWISF